MQLHSSKVPQSDSRDRLPTAIQWERQVHHRARCSGHRAEVIYTLNDFIPKGLKTPPITLWEKPCIIHNYVTLDHGTSLHRTLMDPSYLQTKALLSI